MELTEEQVAIYERDGLVLLTELFSPRETAVLRRALDEVLDIERPAVLLDDDGAVRMVHGIHLEHRAFRVLSRHPRLVEPCRQLLGDAVHLYQSRLNVKPALGRSTAPGYPWHQDFSTWQVEDGLAEPRAIVSFTFLDDVSAVNAPLMVLPGSHRTGNLSSERDAASTYCQTPIEWIARAAEARGVEAVMAPAGSVAFMHCSLVHGSTENISPLRRAICSLVFNAVDNPPTVFDRPERFVSRDVTPVETLGDDCLDDDCLDDDCPEDDCLRRLAT